MQHRVDKIMWELDGDGKIWAKARLLQRPKAALASMDGMYDLTIKRYHKARSLDANAYCWVLCDKIALIIGSTKEDVYRQAIRDVGVCEIVAVQEAAVPRYCACWESHGIGWVAEDMGEAGRSGWHDVMTYYGSSTYDSAEMARLIDYLVSEAQEIGIEILPPRELQALMEAWDGKQASKSV